MAVIAATFVVNWSVTLISNDFLRSFPIPSRHGLPDGCDYFYSHDHTYWAYGSEPCAQFLQHYVNVQYGSCVAVAVAVIDSIVIVQLRLTNQKSISRMNGGQREAATRNMREFRFFMQSIACSGASPGASRYLLYVGSSYYDRFPILLMHHASLGLHSRNFGVSVFKSRFLSDLSEFRGDTFQRRACDHKS
ncbi:hypothetical protein COOONC_05291 [Cooperia oncophora]